MHITFRTSTNKRFGRSMFLTLCNLNTEYSAVQLPGNRTHPGPASLISIWKTVLSHRLDGAAVTADRLPPVARRLLWLRPTAVDAALENRTELSVRLPRSKVKSSSEFKADILHFTERRKTERQRLVKSSVRSMKSWKTFLLVLAAHVSTCASPGKPDSA